MTRDHHRRTRVRTRLAALLLVPMLGSVGFAVAAATGRAAVADRAAEVEAMVADARTKLRLRLLVTDEAFSAGAAAIARTMGVPVDVMSEAVGIDVAATLAGDRAEVDAGFALLGPGDPLAAVHTELEATRADDDAPAADLLLAMSEIQGAVTRAAADSMEAAEAAALDVPSSAELRRVLDVVGIAHEGATAVGVQLDGLSRLLIPAPDDQRQAGLDQLRLGLGIERANAMYLDTRADGRLGAAWVEARDASSSRRAAAAATHYAARSVESTPPVDLAVLGEAVQDAMARIDRYGAFAGATTAEASAVAADLHHDARGEQRWYTIIAALVVLLGLGPAAVFVRSLVSPLRALADRAVRVSAGDLSSSAAGGRGPREVLEVGSALDEAVDVLRAVESSLDAMAAGDLDAMAAAASAPGRLGALVHESVERLSESVRAREQLTRRLAHEATHDQLTGLPNRTSILGSIGRAAARAGRAGGGVTVLVVELRGLKIVNSTHGHEAGNEVLQATAGRLQSLLRDGDVVARVGSADFALVLEGVTDAGAVADVSARLIGCLTAPIEVGAAVTRMTVNIGAAATLDGPVDPESLLRDAGLAAGRARESGENTVEVFDQSMRAELLARADVEERLGAAMAHDELRLHYQPVVTPSLEVVDAEALLRWQRSDGSLVPPGSFIPAAESSDLIIDIGRWVLADATTTLARWHADPSLGGVSISVNLSARHVLSLTVVDDVRRALERSGADATKLVVEVTETVVLSDMERACQHLVGLRDLGVRIAVDDFGTGHTSLAHLRQLPADILKIDRSLIVAASDPADERILDLVVGAAHASDMTVIAEGIETTEQLDLVRRVGCDQLQGFLVARPLPEPDFGSFVADRQRV